MAHIIEHGERVHRERYALAFQEIAKPDCGFAFDCDIHGHLEPLNPVAADNYLMCIRNPEIYRPAGVEVYRWSYWKPAVLECDCGARVYLSAFTNTCDRCHTDYNMSGQRLAPREQWGEETGELPCDCL